MSVFFAQCSLCGASMGQWSMDTDSEGAAEFIRTMKCDVCKQNKVLAQMIVDELIARGVMPAGTKVE